MDNTWLLMEQQKAAALRICSWWMSVWRTCGTPFFPDTTSRPQTTPHENDPNENCKHSCEGQIHFLEHLSHRDLMSFIRVHFLQQQTLHRICGHILFLFQVQRRLQRQNSYLRDNFPKRCIFRGKKIMPSHCLFLTNLNIKMVYFSSWMEKSGPVCLVHSLWMWGQRYYYNNASTSMAKNRTFC